eukprot:352088-Chlamydomonas_euryale.AAC.6
MRNADKVAACKTSPVSTAARPASVQPTHLDMIPERVVYCARCCADSRRAGNAQHLANLDRHKARLLLLASAA